MPLVATRAACKLNQGVGSLAFVQVNCFPPSSERGAAAVALLVSAVQCTAQPHWPSGQQKSVVRGCKVCQAGDGDGEEKCACCLWEVAGLS